MRHETFTGSHYEIGFRWGSLLAKHGNFILEHTPAPLTAERIRFGKACVPACREVFPEILEEIRGIADGQRCSPDQLYALLFGMYAFLPVCSCSCFAVANGENILLGRNSDFLPDLEPLNTNVLYRFDRRSYAFTGNTTAFVEMEDGVNAHGLAIGLTSVYPHTVQPGLNVGILLRLFLEKCRRTEEVIRLIRQIPVSSCGTLTVADAEGRMAVLECSPERINVLRPEDGPFVCAVNVFCGNVMLPYNHPDIDNWQAERRLETMRRSLTENAPQMMGAAEAVDLLSGRDGFLCQYDRSTGKDTVWSVVYDLKNRRIYRAEGNPGRCSFLPDNRFDFDVQRG